MVFIFLLNLIDRFFCWCFALLCQITKDIAPSLSPISLCFLFSFLFFCCISSFLFSLSFSLSLPLSYIEQSTCFLFFGNSFPLLLFHIFLLQCQALVESYKQCEWLINLNISPFSSIQQIHHTFYLFDCLFFGTGMPVFPFSSNKFVLFSSH